MECQRTYPQMSKNKKFNLDSFFLFCYFLTFSSLVGVETEIDESPLEVFVAGKRSRFNRIGFVSFVDVVSFDDINNKRLVMDGVEQGNGISTAKIKKLLIVLMM